MVKPAPHGNPGEPRIPAGTVPVLASALDHLVEVHLRLEQALSSTVGSATRNLLHAKTRTSTLSRNK